MSKQTPTEKGEKIVSVLLEKGEYSKLTFLTLASIGVNIFGGFLIPVIVLLILAGFNILFSGLTMLNIITIGAIYVATLLFCAKYVMYVQDYVEYLENEKKKHNFKVGDIITIKNRKKLKKDLLYLLNMKDRESVIGYWNILSCKRVKIIQIDDSCIAYVNSKYKDCVILESIDSNPSISRNYYPLDIFDENLNEKINKLMKL